MTMQDHARGDSKTVVGGIKGKVSWKGVQYGDAK